MFSENSFMVVLLRKIARISRRRVGRRFGLTRMWVRAANVQAGVLTVVPRSAEVGCEAGRRVGWVYGVADDCMVRLDSHSSLTVYGI